MFGVVGMMPECERRSAHWRDVWHTWKPQSRETERNETRSTPQFATVFDPLRYHSRVGGAGNVRVFGGGFWRLVMLRGGERARCARFTRGNSRKRGFRGQDGPMNGDPAYRWESPQKCGDFPVDNKGKKDNLTRFESRQIPAWRTRRTAKDWPELDQNANHQSTRSQEPKAKAQVCEISGLGEVPSEAGCLLASTYYDTEEAELGSAEDYACTFE